MHQWTTPPTSWPTPLQPANPSWTWPPQSTSMASTPRPPTTWPTTAPPPTSTPQPAFTIEPQQYCDQFASHRLGTTPTPVEHLFGQPSALHPTWPSSTSSQQTASTMPPLSFASLATAPHAVPASHLVPATTSPLSPDTTTLHTNLPVFATPMAPTFPTTWPTAPPPSQRNDNTTYTSTRITVPHLVSSNHHHWLLRHRLFLQLHLNHTASQSSPKGSIRKET